MNEVIIPERLRDERIRFIRVAQFDKNPAEPSEKVAGYKWYEKGYTWDDPVLQNHLTNGGNYGILGGHGGIVIIDVDVEWLNNVILDHMPPTFTTRSGGKEFYHLLYRVGEETVHVEKKIMDKHGVEAGDVISYKSQVVGPNSVVQVSYDADLNILKKSDKKTPLAYTRFGTYEVFRDVPIHETTWEELDRILTIIIEQDNREPPIPEPTKTPPTPKPVQEEKPKKKKEKTVKYTKAQQHVIDEIKRKIPLRRVFEEIGGSVFSSDTGNGSCPFHESAGGICLSVNQNPQGVWVYHCFHTGCEREGDIFTFLQEFAKKSFMEIVTLFAPKLGLRYPGNAETLEDLDLDSLTKAEQLETLRNECFAAIVNGKNEKMTDLVSQYITQELHIKTESIDNNPTTWYYDGKIYRTDGVVKIKELCRLILRDQYQYKFYKVILDKIQADTLISYEEFTTNADRYPHLLPVQNGILNVLTNEIMAFTPDIYYTSLLPSTYDPTKDCPRFKQFIHDIMNGNEEYITTIREMIGYFLYRGYPIQRGFIQYGDGANGKGVLQNVLRKFLGDENYSTLNLKQLSNDDKFTLHKLHNRYANISDEAIEELTETSILKTLIGNGSFSVSVKYKPGFKMTNTAKLIFSANSFPHLPEKVDDAFFRRWMFIPFIMKYCTPAEMQELSEEQRKFARPMNPHIEAELINDDEFSGILNWAITGLQTIMKNNGFTYTKGIQENKQIWMSKTGSSYVFIKRYIRNKEGNMVKIATIKNTYTAFCLDMGVPQESQQVFNKNMEQFTAGMRDRQRLEPYEPVSAVWTNIELIDTNERMRNKAQEELNIEAIRTSTGNKNP